MRLATARRPGLRRRSGQPAAAAGPARLGRSTKELTRRLRPGEVAVIDHPDLDRVSAQALIERRPAAVVNAAASISGRYPNEGPQLLVAAGIPLLDEVGEGIFASAHDGLRLQLSGDVLCADGHPIARGARLEATAVAAAMAAARGNVAQALEDFAANTMEFLRRERDLFIEGAGTPALRTSMAGRQVLVVVRGYDYKQDLASLRPYVRDFRPVLVGVDGGADALLEAGLKPDLIVGDMDSVTDRALSCGAELVVHAYPDGSAPGSARVAALDLPAQLFATGGTSEDAALLLADAGEAALIVAVGTHATLVEFLDKGREGMASTFLTRLRLGGRLVDAKGVSRLYRSRISGWALIALVLATLVTFAAALAVSEAGRTYLLLFSGWWHDVLRWAGRHV